MHRVDRRRRHRFASMGVGRLRSRAMTANQHECYECGRVYDRESDAKRCNLICKTNYDMSH